MTTRSDTQPRHPRNPYPWGLTAVTLVAIALVIWVARWSERPSDLPAASGFGEAGASSPRSTETPSPWNSTPTSMQSLDIRLQTIEAAVVPTATVDLPPRATQAPKPTCPVYGTATREGRCYTYPPTATVSPTQPPKMEPTTPPCPAPPATPVPRTWCEYGPADG